MSEEIKRIIDDEDTHSHFERIKHLIQEEGVDIDQVGFFNNTLLITAAFCGDLECVKFLIQNGANIEHQNSDQWTPLHFAASGGDLDVLKYLIQNGAFIDAVNKQDRTPLMVASYMGCVDVAKYLLDMGANHSIQDKDGKTPLQISEEESETEVVDILRQHIQEKTEMYRRMQEQKEENDFHRFHGIAIQSSNELQIILSHLEKQLDSFECCGLMDMPTKEWLVETKTLFDANNRKDGKSPLPSLEDLVSQIKQLGCEKSQRAVEHSTQLASLVRAAPANNDNAVDSQEDAHNNQDQQHGELMQMATEYQNYMTEIEEKVSAASSAFLKAKRAYEQRLVAMGQL